MVSSTATRGGFAGARIAVLGMARSGRAAAMVLARQGAHVVASDMATGPDLERSAAELASSGIETRLGADPSTSLSGCNLVVTSPGIPLDSPVLRHARALGVPVISEIEAAYRISAAQIIAITGTNGKTTTTAMLGEIGRSSGRRTFVAGNIADDAPESPLISAAESAEPGDLIVAEVSSFQLECVERFQPRVGVITNISPDHLNRHGDLGSYASAKARLFEAQGPEDTAVLNSVNARCRLVSRAVRSRVIWFDRTPIRGAEMATVVGGRIVIQRDGETTDIMAAGDLRVPGKCNLENALAAAAAATAFGIVPDAVAEGLSRFTGVAHRLEPVGEAGGVLYVNNSMCTNVESTIRSLEALGRPAVVIAGGAEKGLDYAPLGSAFKRYARYAVLIGREAPAIESALRQTGFHAVCGASGLDEAVTMASNVARPGDVVVLSPTCASFDMFADFRERGAAFREAVRRRIEREL